MHYVTKLDYSNIVYFFCILAQTNAVNKVYIGGS